jgi:hypothetical protein
VAILQPRRLAAAKGGFMLRPIQTLASVATMLAVALGPAAAQIPAAPAAAGTANVTVMTNTSKGYQIGYPSGWQAVNAESVDYAFLPADNSALCMANAGPVPDLANVSEDELKAALSVPLGETFWDGNYFEGMANKKYLDIGANPNHPGGWPVQTVVAQGDLDLEGQALPAVFSGLMTFKSGSGFQVMCFTASASYGQAKPAFDAILASFKVIK